MSIVKSKSRNAFVGDTVRIMTARHTSTDGKDWPRGTQFVALSSGFNNLKNRTEQNIIINGNTVVF